ncbi:MAG: tripartite tricarboxylate transporter TctB family protein [Hyphomicrobiales bacterium]|nr:tripartite tricarboxylate transporter TctB family protein [Hyphomicrobiales bacterium]
MVTSNRVSALLLLALSVAYFIASYDIELYPGSEEEWITAQTFPRYIGGAAILLSFLILVLPSPSDEGLAQWKTFDWVRPGLLCLLMIGYGLTIKTVGFLLSTTVFLAAGYMVLGERRWWVLLVASLPVAAGFEFILAGLLDITIRDPFLEMIGITGR